LKLNNNISVALCRQKTGWGSFSYDQRIQVGGGNVGLLDASSDFADVRRELLRKF
jgi:hypothetical protein